MVETTPPARVDAPPKRCRNRKPSAQWPGKTAGRQKKTPFAHRHQLSLSASFPPRRSTTKSSLLSEKNTHSCNITHRKTHLPPFRRGYVLIVSTTTEEVKTCRVPHNIYIHVGSDCIGQFWEWRSSSLTRTIVARHATFSLPFLDSSPCPPLLHRRSKTS